MKGSNVLCEPELENIYELFTQNLIVLGFIMKGHATGTIESKNWSFQPVEELENGCKLIRMGAVDLFHGSIEGEAKAEFVAMLRSDNSSEFVGMYRISGTMDGHSGKFLLAVKGSSDSKGVSQGTWQVVPGSAYAALRGLTGSGKFRYQSGGASSFSLDYDLE